MSLKESIEKQKRKEEKEKAVLDRNKATTVRIKMSKAKKKKRKRSKVGKARDRKEKEEEEHTRSEKRATRKRKGNNPTASLAALQGYHLTHTRRVKAFAPWYMTFFVHSCFPKRSLLFLPPPFDFYADLGQHVTTRGPRK